MKKVSLMIVCLATMLMAGTGLKAQEITITLEPGWNWISYTNSAPMQVGDALGDFVPMEGDIIQAQRSNTQYRGGHWRGGLTQFVPGRGYKYYSSRTENVELVFAQASSTSVVTAMPTDITTTSAVVGGTVTLPEGTHVFLRGMCWGAEPSPDIDGSHTTEGTGIGSFSDTLEGLTPNTTYYVRAYAVSDYGLAYGDELNFTTEAYHAYVDLGLPSGLLWATCNVGADNPEDYGDYFAWGETQTKDEYNWSTYQYSNGGFYDEWGEEPYLTKYCTNSYYGYNGFTDDLTILLPEDDAATANWGSDWRMPTLEEWQELYNNTTHTWTTQNGVNGRLFTASNGNSLFLPAAGVRYDSDLDRAGSDGLYWSSSLSTVYPNCAWYFYFNSGDCDLYFYDRGYGFTVRPVCSKSFIINATANSAEGGTVTGGGTYQVGQSCTLTATANSGYTFTNWTENGNTVSTEASYTFTVNSDRDLVANFTFNGGGGGDHAYVDLGLPSGLLWATCNVGAEAPEDYGDYFAWGETQPKDIYNWSTYQYYDGSNVTKYTGSDGLTTLLPEDDAATANWGSDWRMPTKEEWQELYNNTTVTWTTQNGVNGRLFTASNGNSLFLPAAGCRDDSNLNGAGSGGYYWSSSLYTGGPSYAWYFTFYSGDYILYYCGRNFGLSVRAVRVGSQN